MVDAFDNLIAQCLTQAQGQLISLCASRARAHHHELFAAQTTEHVVAAQALADLFRNRPEHLIACSMPETVIDTLEVIDVEHDDRKITPMPVDPFQLGLHAVLKKAPVIGAGQYVGD